MSGGLLSSRAATAHNPAPPEIHVRWLPPIAVLCIVAKTGNVSCRVYSWVRSRLLWL